MQMPDITEIFARVDERAQQFPARAERRAEAHYDHQHHGAAVAARCFMEVLSAMADHRRQSQAAAPRSQGEPARPAAAGYQAGQP
jgi:hypothetical protein